MKCEKYKLFWKANDKNKNIELIKWNEKECEYYAFIKEQMSKGYHQISVTSEIMLGFLSEISSKSCINISKIELMEEDREEGEELNNMVDECSTNRGMLVKIINKLKYLEDESSIEIKRVYFTEKIEIGEYGLFFVQVNGLIGISGNEMKVVDILKKYIWEIINV